uniref:Integrase catalytic domain-containing protein n=1 Tax=Vitis vinifera TaxID=29760 RepID=A5BSF3_VITVI|nr:hypothetical protein VITISV_010698 [Vitis vinifera]
MGMNTIKNRGCCMGEGEDKGGRGQPSEDFSKHQHMPWEVGRQLIASVLLSINEVELSIYRFLSLGAKNSKRLSLPRPDLDHEENHLDREEMAIGRERKFCASLNRSSTEQGQPVDRFPNRLSRLAIASTENETIVEMITRFTDIVNGLEALGKTYKESEKVMKILRFFPSKWHTKVTAIQEAKDLTKLPIEELIGSLMTYEINLIKKLQKGEAKKRMKKAMMATWSESEESSEEEKEKEVANMCFMAIDDLDEVQNEKGFTITCIRSDHGREFENIDFEDYCNEYGINHNFSAPRTPQQNRVVEKKNRTLQEMAKTMLNENNLPKYFWAEAVNISCYVLNKILLRPILKKTPYELWKNKKPNIRYFKIFGCKCFILNTKDNFGKFDAKLDVGIFLGYSTSSKAFRVFNKRTMVVEESIHVIFYESNNSLQERESFDDDLGLETSMGKLKIEDRRQQEEIVEDPKKEESPLALPPPQQVQGKSSQDLPKDWKFVINHPPNHIIGNPSSGVRTRSSLRNICNNLAFISQIEPKNIKDALVDENWMIVMQEELNQFERSEIWELVARPQNQSVIGTR